MVKAREFSKATLIMVSSDLVVRFRRHSFLKETASMITELEISTHALGKLVRPCQAPYARR
jgi:hypothetical protein